MPLVSGLRDGFQHAKALVTNHQVNPVQATPAQPLEEELTLLALSSFMPSAAPKTSRYPSSLTAIATK